VVRLLDYLTGIAALLGLPFIAWWGVNQSPQSAGMLEARLQARAMVALQASGIDWAGVGMDGQTAILTGAAPSEDAVAEAARIVLRSSGRGGLILGGVSQVRSEAVQAPPVRPYLWTAETSSGGGLVLAGHVPSKAVRAQLILEAEAIARGPVEDRMVLASGAPAGNWQGIARLALAELAGLDKGRAQLSDHVLTVRGIAMDDGLRARVTRAISAVAAPFEGVALLQGAPLWSASWIEGELVLSGAVPAEADRRALVSLARRASGREVRDEMVVTDASVGDWVGAARAGLAHFARFSAGFMTFDAATGSLTFEGQAPASTLQFLSEDMAGFEGRWRVVIAATPQAGLQAPAGPGMSCAGRINAQLASGKVGFEPGSAAFRRSGGAALDAFAAEVAACPPGQELELLVQDDALALARAGALADYLRRAGLARPRLAVIGYGPAEADRGMDTGAAAVSDRPFEFTVRDESAEWPG